jgi:hypothetical protein
MKNPCTKAARRWHRGSRACAQTTQVRTTSGWCLNFSAAHDAPIDNVSRRQDRVGVQGAAARTTPWQLTAPIGINGESAPNSHLISRHHYITSGFSRCPDHSHIMCRGLPDSHCARSGPPTRLAWLFLRRCRSPDAGTFRTMDVQRTVRGEQTTVTHYALVGPDSAASPSSAAAAIADAGGMTLGLRNRSIDGSYARRHERGTSETRAGSGSKGRL